IDTLEEGQIELPQNIDASLLKRQNEVQKLIESKAAALTQLLNNVHTEAQAASIKTDLGALISEDEDLQAKIRSSNPKYAIITRAQVLDFPAIQSLLDTDTVLLEYALGEDRSYVWAVTRDSIAAFELSSRVNLEALAQRFRDVVVRRDRQQQS